MNTIFCASIRGHPEYCRGCWSIGHPTYSRNSGSAKVCPDGNTDMNTAEAEEVLEAILNTVEVVRVLAPFKYRTSCGSIF